MPDDVPKFTKSPTMKVTKPKDKKKADRMTSDMAAPVTEAPKSCAPTPGSFDYEQGAFAFGEEKTSFHQINVTEKEILRK